MINLTLRFFCCLIVMLTFTTCAKNPVTGRRMLSFMSTKQEISLGKEADPSIQGSFGVYDDAKLQKFLSDKGLAMAKISHRPNLPWQFKVVDSPVVNAFAVPGGFVYFTRGIMAHFNSEAQLAGVLGHEIGHVTARHGARQQTGQILGQIGLIAGLIAVPELVQFADIANQGMGLVFLKFGRNHETESDKLGVSYSTKIGYDAHHMADFFRTLKRLGDKGGAGDIPTFLSTHPNPVDREKNVDALAASYQTKMKTRKFEERRDEYLQMIDGIVYGEDPKQGFVENQMFYHPELKFQFPVPKGWKYENSPTQFQMASADGKAVMLMTLATGKTLDEAAQNTTKQYSLRVANSRRTKNNGMNCLVMESEQVAQQQQGGQQQQAQNAVKVLTHLIEYGGLIYAFHGLTYANIYNQHARTFETTAQGFNMLTDPEKLGRKPERIRIQRLTRDMSFGEAMTQYNMPSTRLEELAILNGMESKTPLKSGTLVKTVAR